jgi:transposase
MLPEKRAPMRKVKEILRLHFEAQLSERQISKICQVGKGTIRRYLERLKAAGLSWPLPDDLDEATLEKKLFPPPPPPSAGERPLPDCAQIHKELKSPNVTLQLLWEEYKQAQPDGYNYSCYVASVLMWRSHVNPMTDKRSGDVDAT